MNARIYRIDNGSMKRDFIWNMLGNLFFAAHSVVMLALVSRFCGTEDAGVFSLTFSIAQMMYLVSCFELANVLITDSRNTIRFWQSVGFRITTNILMVLCAAGFAWKQGFTGYKLQAFSLLILYMLLLSFAELCESQLHHNGYLFLSGRSLALNTALSSIAFASVLFFTRNMLYAIGAMCGVVVIWLLVYDIPFIRAVKADRQKGKLSVSALKMLVKLCLPLVCMRLIMSYVINSPKLAIDTCMTLKEQSYYGYMMMPAACVNLLNLFVLRPQLLNLANAYNERDAKKFKKIVLMLLAYNMVIMACVLLGGYFLGIPILSMFYGVDLSGYEQILCIVLLGGCFYSFATMFDAVETAMRSHQWNLLVYIPTLLASLTVTYSLVKNLGLWGAALSYMLLMLLLAVGSGVVLIVFYRKKFFANKD